MPNTDKPKTLYIYNMPYREREELCKILETTDKWKSLGGLMQYDTQQIHELDRMERRGKSPADELLSRWSQQNHTVLELFYLLKDMQHFQAMMVLKPFVDEKHHHWIYDGKHSASDFTKAGEGACCHPSTLLPVVGGGVADEVLGYGRHNWNVMLPEARKFNKEGFPDSQPKIQNIRSPISVEENSPQQEHVLVSPGMPSAPSASPTPPTNFPRGVSLVGAGLENLRLSPAGVAALAAGHRPISTHSNSAQNQNHLQMNVPTGSTPQRKLSVASLAASPSDWGTLPQCDYKDMEIATQSWAPQNIIGKGGFGTVFVGNWKNTKVAIKRLELPKGETRGSQEVQIQQSLTELSILQTVRHDNILQLYGFSLGGDYPCLVYQYMEKGSLEDRLQCKNRSAPLNWPLRYNIAKGTAKGVQYLHTRLDKPLIHGDIKSANILLDSNLEPRIGDFGLAREGPHTQFTHMQISRVHGTRPYLPDEFLRSNRLSTKVDTYSFGVVLFELATGLRAYDEKRTNRYLKDEVTSCPPDDIMRLVDEKAGPSHVEMFKTLICFGKMCVHKDTKERPDMAEVWTKLNQHHQLGGQPSPFELQVRHDQWSQQRRQSLSQTPQVLAPASGGPAPSNLPAASNSVAGHPSAVMRPQTPQGMSQGVSGHTSPNNLPESSRPFIYGAGNGQDLVIPKNAGHIGALKLGEIPAPCQELLLPTILPGAHQVPFPSPVISVMPATGSALSISSSQSSIESSSVYSSHESQKVMIKEWEEQTRDQEPENIPLLSVLGTLPTPEPRAFANHSEISTQSSSSSMNSGQRAHVSTHGDKICIVTGDS